MEGKFSCELVTQPEEKPVLIEEWPVIGEKKFVRRIRVNGTRDQTAVVERNEGLQPDAKTVVIACFLDKPLFEPVSLFELDTRDITGHAQLLPDTELISQQGFLKVSFRLV